MNLPFTEDGLDIIDRAICADFTEDELHQALIAPPSAKAELSCTKLAAQVKRDFAGPKFTMLISKVSSFFSKAILDRNDGLRSYRESYVLAHAMLKTNLAKEANEWAEYIIKERPDLAIELCSSDVGRRFMTSGVEILLNGKGAVGRKRFDKNREKFMTRVSSASLRLAETAVMDGKVGMQAGVTIAAEDLFGGARPLMAYALSLQYGHLIMFLVMVSIGCEPDLIAGMRDLADIENDEFRLDVAEFSEIIDHLGPEVLACALGDMETAYLVAASCERNLSAVGLLCDEIQSLMDAQAIAKRQSHKDEAALRDELRRQARVIESLQRAQGTDTTRALQEEVASLQKEAARLRGELAQRAERIGRLEASPKRMNAHHEPPRSPSSSPAPVAAASTGNSINFEDGLALLRGMKGVVVGGHTIFHAKLHELLPNWTCYDADETGAEVAVIRHADLVVFHTSYCSHKLSEGVLRTARSNDIPVGYAYKVNPQAFVAEVVKIATTLKRRSREAVTT